MVVCVVRDGVIEAALITIDGEIGPKYSNIPAPDDAVPIPAYVSVSDGDPVLAGKFIAASGETVCEPTVQPDDVLTTATRA